MRRSCACFVVAPSWWRTNWLRLRTRVDRASQVIAAPALALYEALVDPVALAVWLPPEGMTARVEAFDAHEGGVGAAGVADMTRAAASDPCLEAPAASLRFKTIPHSAKQAATVPA
jgi:hypothetical protein